MQGVPPQHPARIPTGGLFHIVEAEQWARARAAGELRPPSLAHEGFVHCSFGAQVADTLTRHFPGPDGLLVLELDAALIDEPIRVEDSYGRGESFPHVYGPIPISAVVGARPAAEFTAPDARRGDDPSPDPDNHGGASADP